MPERAGTPTAWHQRWLTLTRLPAHEGAAQSHGEWCRLLEVMAQYDQLQCAALASAELACRQLQLLEERYKDK
eukprot:6936517-Alexandrium_andersonii.AAC.1